MLILMTGRLCGPPQGWHELENASNKICVENIIILMIDSSFSIYSTFSRDVIVHLYI